MEALCLDGVTQDGHRLQVIDRDVEEALHLWGVQIHRHNCAHPQFSCWHETRIVEAARQGSSYRVMMVR